MNNKYNERWWISQINKEKIQKLKKISSNDLGKVSEIKKEITKGLAKNIKDESEENWDYILWLA